MTNPLPPDDRPDPERDAWLTAALRHAPDAQAAPPAAVSDAILRAARAATHAAPGPGPANPPGAWARAWAWLARPPVAAGFASVMVATLVGLIWWDQPVDPTAPPTAPTATESPAPPAPAAAPAPQPAAPKPPAVRRTAPEVVPPAAPAPAPQADAAAAEAADESNAARRAEAVDNRAASKAANPAPPRPAALAALLASIAAEPQRWHWQRNGLAQPMTPALQRWLTQVDAAAATHWQRSDAPAPAPIGRVLRLYRDGAPAATLRFDAERVWITPETHAATLPAPVLEQLLQSLDAATP